MTQEFEHFEGREIGLTECCETWYHSGNAENLKGGFLVNDSDY